MHYGDYSRNYRNQEHDYQRDRNSERNSPYRGRTHANLGDTRSEPGEHYRLQHSRNYGQQGGRVGNRDDRYEEMYDISNYSDQPRSQEYGLYRGTENELERVERFPYAEGPYAGRGRNYRYNMGYNPNYDNPEEGDRYRDFDSRGNHGYRHDASYGNQDAFREFGNDHFGRRSRSDDPYYGYFGGYNR